MHPELSRRRHLAPPRDKLRQGEVLSAEHVALAPFVRVADVKHVQLALLAAIPCRRQVRESRSPISSEAPVVPKPGQRVRPERGGEDLLPADGGDEPTGLGYLGFVLGDEDEAALKGHEPAEVGGQVAPELEVQGPAQMLGRVPAAVPSGPRPTPSP